MPEKDFLIAPSILSADFAKLGAEVDASLAAGADVVHFDVMDNHYVPNLTIGPMVCSALRKHGVTAPIDVHLMVSPVDRIVQDFADAGASYITFHPEASPHVCGGVRCSISRRWRVLGESPLVSRRRVDGAVVLYPRARHRRHHALHAMARWYPRSTPSPRAGRREPESIVTRTPSRHAINAKKHRSTARSSSSARRAASPASSSTPRRPSTSSSTSWTRSTSFC